MKSALYILVAIIVLLTIIFMVVDLLGITKCSNCQETIIGKPERINEKPVCDRCFSEMSSRRLKYGK